MAPPGGDSELPPSSTIGGYRVVRALDSGSMGMVYVGEGPTGPVAIKVLRSALVRDPELVGRFLDEARAASRLRHPNVVRVIDHGLLGRTPYIVMELLDGVPVIAYTRGGGRLPPRAAMVITDRVLRALGAAHAAGLVHRDLKPGNVYLARDGKGAFEVKVLDFGVAKVLGDEGRVSTRTGTVLGTPAYMSPEQVRSAKDVDGRTDLWSAGVMLYRMLTGVLPFAGDNDVDRLSAVMYTHPPPLSHHSSYFAPLDPFMARALQKDRDQRFQSAAEMAAALQQVAMKMGVGPL